MNSLAEETKIDRPIGGSATAMTNTGVELMRTLFRQVKTHRKEALLRRTMRGLDGLNEHLLKDVGLFREHLPSGATRVRRR